MALKDDGTIWGWGTNINGQLGLGNTIPLQIKAVQMGTGNTWDTIISCQNSTLARKTDGTLWGWGLNGDGELGIGSFGQKITPVLVGNASDWRSITSSKGAFTVAVRSDGTLWGWGANDRGNLGIGTTDDQPSPVLISSSTDWKKIACGFNHVIALKTDGTLWGWGDNLFKQVSDGASVGMQTTPIQIGLASDWADITAGESFTVGVKTDGTLWAWGKNMYGQLGVGNTNPYTTQVQVGTGNDWSTVFAGLEHVVAAKTNGSLWGWGLNTSGELGHNNAAYQTVPAELGTGTAGWTSVVAGYRFTTVLRADKSIWASGKNNWSLLGNGGPGTDLTSFSKAGSLNYAPYVPVLGGGSSLLSASCDSDFMGYYSFGSALSSNQKLFAIHPKGNTGSFTITYDSSRNTNSSPLVQSDATQATSLMGRLVTVTYSGTIDKGVSVRFYYNAADSTNTSNALDNWISAHPGTIKRWHWVKYEGDAAALVSNQTPGGFSGVFSMGRPDTSGSENGVRFAEFRHLKSFSTFGGFAYANLTNTPFSDVLLPVTIRYFTAYRQGMTTALTWTTASESNNKGFTIERSSTSLDWQTIGYVPSLASDGNSVVDLQYKYTDEKPAPGTNFYRLKQEDQDGKTSFSRIVSVTFNSNNVINVYPNPAKEIFYVSGMTGGETVSIYSVFGQLQRSEKIPGNGTYQLSLKGLSKGMYFIRVNQKTTVTKSFKLLVEKIIKNL